LNLNRDSLLPAYPTGGRSEYPAPFFYRDKVAQEVTIVILSTAKDLIFLLSFPFFGLRLINSKTGILRFLLPQKWRIPLVNAVIPAMTGIS